MKSFYWKITRNILWLLPKYKYEIVFNMGENRFAIRKVYFIGKIKGIDWGRYENEPLANMYFTSAQLMALADNIKNMCAWSEFTKREII